MVDAGSRLGLVAILLTIPACASGGGPPPCTARGCGDAGALDARPTDGGAPGGDAGLLDAPTGSPDAPAGPLDAPAGTDARSDAGASGLDAPVAPSDAGGIVRCPAGEALIGRVGGSPICGAIAPAVAGYVNASCSLYLGWRDSCGACSDPPAKWGRVSDASCETTGTNGTCETATLGAATVRLYGLNPDGDVDDNDKLYVGFLCDPAPAGGPASGVCPAGQFVTGIDGSGAITCAPVGAVAEAAVNDDCSLYLGARDSCDGCAGAPAEWGRVGGDTCAIGAGGGGTCSIAALGARNVTLYGIDLDGDVNGDDQIYLGLDCAGGATSETRVLGACPPGTLATGAGSDGSLVCTGVAPDVEATVGSQCFVYLGWRDSCDGCALGPSKWGRANGAATCENGVGADAVCTTSPTTLFGISTDGDVGDDDKLYVGIHCF